MILASHIKDMNFEEILGIFSPILFLVPLVFAVLFLILLVSFVKSLAPYFAFFYMDLPGISAEKKRAFLTKHLTNATFIDSIKGRKNCPVCCRKSRESTQQRSSINRGQYAAHHQRRTKSRTRSATYQHGTW